MNDNYNAFIAIWREEALVAARETEREIAGGNYRGPLHGVPIALKDIFATRGCTVTNGSQIYAHTVSDDDATVVARLRSAGAILMGSLNLYQFACGTVMNPDYGPVRNAWNRDHIAGGSSSGSGTAVAADMCFGTLGTDTGGSIRIPAVLNGIVGLKPTYGRVSRHGVFPLSASLDHAGPLTKDVRDTALMMNVIAGHDPNDPTTSTLPVPDYTASLIGEMDGLRVGLPQPYFFEDLQPSVREAVMRAIEQLTQLGGRVEEQTLNHLDEAPRMLWDQIAGDAGVVHAEHLAEHADILDPDVRQLAERGARLLATDYVKAQQRRDEIRQQMLEALESTDVLVTPTSPIVSPRLGDDGWLRWVARPSPCARCCAVLHCPSTCRACQRAPFLAVSAPMACRLGCRLSASRLMRPPSCVWPTPTSKRRTGIDSARWSPDGVWSVVDLQLNAKILAIALVVVIV